MLEKPEKGMGVAWFVLISAGILESVWAIALERSNGFSQIVPSIIFVAALVLSMLGLSFALKTLPLGTSYAIWVGIGATLTVVYGMLTGEESVNMIKVALITGLILCIIGLKVVSGDPATN